MARSLKKGPYVAYHLQGKVDAMNASNKKTVIKTWSRASMITPDFVGLSLSTTLQEHIEVEYDNKGKASAYLV